MRSELGVGHGFKHRLQAEMSEERFAEILIELQARGDKTKLMQLFGH
jgi:hypothetical protein